MHKKGGIEEPYILTEILNYQLPNLYVDYQLVHGIETSTILLTEF